MLILITGVACKVVQLDVVLGNVREGFWKVGEVIPSAEQFRRLADARPGVRAGGRPADGHGSCYWL